MSAAPPTVLQVDVDLEKLDRESDLKFSETEPIGLAVTMDGGRYWQQIGCKVGDLIQRMDGDPTSTSQSGFSEGVHSVELLRDGKPVLLRVVVHGPVLRTVHLTASDAADVVTRIDRSGAGAIAIPLKHAQGVRVIESGLDSGLELRPGDIVVAIGDRAIASEADLIEAMKNISAGHTNVTLHRDGRTLTVTWEREPDVP
ncbi:MAG TPA: PDZ domain-containing protein [Kofleriaceae bacterium]